MFITLDQLKQRLSELNYKDWGINVYDGDLEGRQLEIRAMMKDNFNPEQLFQFHCVSPLPPFTEIRQFDYYLLWRLKRIEIHECMENLKTKIDGKPLFNPHRPDSDRDLL